MESSLLSWRLVVRRTRWRKSDRDRSWKRSTAQGGRQQQPQLFSTISAQHAIEIGASVSFMLLARRVSSFFSLLFYVCLVFEKQTSASSLPLLFCLADSPPFKQRTFKHILRLMRLGVLYWCLARSRQRCLEGCDHGAMAPAACLPVFRLSIFGCRAGASAPVVLQQPVKHLQTLFRAHRRRASCMHRSGNKCFTLL